MITVIKTDQSQANGQGGKIFSMGLTISKFVEMFLQTEGLKGSIFIVYKSDSRNSINFYFD